jgi:hypothetical protein
VVPRPEIATVERRGARSRSQRDHRVLSRGIAPRQRDRRLSGALRRSAAPLVRGVGRRTRDDPRAKRRAETRGDGTMEGNEGDVTMKRVRIGRMPNGQRGGAHRSTTVILRCERKRASKDERPAACGGSGPSPFEALASLGHLRVTVTTECARHDTMRRHDAVLHDEV